MNRRRKIALAASLLVVGGTLAGIALTRPSGPKLGHRFGLTIYTVPVDYQSTGTSSSNNGAASQCATATWKDANNPASWTPPSSDPPLLTVLRGLASGTEVDFAADGCYEINTGFKMRSTDPGLSFNGNPSGVPNENAMLYDSDTSPDGTNQVGASILEPILTLTGTNNDTVEHLLLAGGDRSADYIAKNADSSGILLLGTNDTVINDVHARSMFGDCLTTENNTPSGAFASTTTNLLVENFWGNFCGRQGIAPLELQGALFCGVTVGAGNFGNSWDFEVDSPAPDGGAENVTVTGLPCDNDGVLAQGCNFSALVNIDSNPTDTGPIFFNDCVSIDEGGAGSVRVQPECQYGNATTQGDIAPGTVTAIPIVPNMSTVTTADIPAGTNVSSINVSSTPAGVDNGSILTVDGQQFTTNHGGANKHSTVIKVVSQVTSTDIPSGSTVLNGLQTSLNPGDLLDINGVTFTIPGSGAPDGVLAIPVASQVTTADIPNGTPVKWTDLCTGSSVPNGPIIFSHDQIMCGAASGFACFDVSGPYTLSVRSANVLVSFSGTQQKVWASSNSFIARGIFGASLFLDSDCVSGFLKDSTNTPPYGTYSPPLSSISVVPPGGNYNGGTRNACPLVSQIWSSPTASSVTLGTSDTDASTVQGAAGPGSPTGTVSYYACGPFSVPTPCTAKTRAVGSVALTTTGGDASLATSAAFTAPSRGYWCFAAYYGGQTFGAGGYYKPSSDTSAVTPFVGNSPAYDGCFDVT